MNDWSPVLKMARPALALLVGVVAICIAVVAGIGYFVKSTQTQLDQVQRSTQNQRAALQVKKSDLTYLSANKLQYEALRERGLFSLPDHRQWIAQLQSSYQTLDLGDSLTFEVSAPKPVRKVTPIAAGKPMVVATDVEFFVHDLQFEMQEVHEVDVLNLLQDLNTSFKERHRVNACKMTNPQENGFTARCVLRFITVPPPAAPLPPAPKASAANNR